MLDEETGAEPRAISASIVDPYLLLIRDDSSIFLAQIDSSNELEEVEKTDDTLLSTKWLAGCLYTDTSGVFQPSLGDKGTETEKTMMFLLSSTGALHVSGMRLGWARTDSRSRYMLCPTYRSRCMWLRVYHMSRHFSRPTILYEEERLARP